MRTASFHCFAFSALCAAMLAVPSLLLDAAESGDAPELKIAATQTLTPEASPDVHYKLRLPPAYGTDAAHRFPLLINQNPSGRTNLKPYETWADQQGVILLGIDGISNGKEQGKKNFIADAVLKDLETRGVRAHPTLRMTIGMSGGSADGFRLVRRKPASYAGCVYMGSGTIMDKPDAKHLAYAILGGAKDEWMPGDVCYAMEEKARALGCAVRIEVEIDRQHKEAPIDRQFAALSWMLELQKLQLPALIPEERVANLAAARERLAAVAKISDPAAQRAEVELLLSLEPLAQFTAERAAVVALDKKLNPPTVATPLEKRYRFAEEAECHAGLKPEKLAEVLPVWETLAKDAAGTEWEPKVARRIRIVKLFIETPSNIQKPTKLKD